jgi:hypothetical protein
MVPSQAGPPMVLRRSEHGILQEVLSGFIRLPTEGYTQGGRFWVRMRRDQELEGADNTRFRQVQAAICVMPYILYDGLYCLDVDLEILVLRGSLPALIYPGGQGYMMWQNQPELYRLKYASQLPRATTCFKRYNPLACRVTSR